MSTSWPEQTAEHEQAWSRVWESGRFVDGDETAALEEEAAAALGWKYAVAVTNGTVAITAALAATGCGPGSLVGVPAVSFSGSVIPAVSLGATPVFADVGADDLVVTEWPDWPDVEFVVPVHLHGRVAPTPSIPRRASARSAEDGHVVIDDSCQAPSARTTNAVAACVSLNQTKTLWGGEGGLVLTDSEHLAQRVRILRRFGEAPDRGLRREYVCVSPGYNWRMTEASAAMARASLLHLPRWEAQSELVAGIIAAGLEDCESGRLVEGEYSGVHKLRLLLADHLDIEEVVRELRVRGVPAGYWQTLPLPYHPAFSRFIQPGQKFPNANHLLKHSIIVGDEATPPCAITESEAHRWAEVIQEVLP